MQCLGLVASIKKGRGRSDNIQCPQYRSQSDLFSCFLQELQISAMGEAKISLVPGNTFRALVLLLRSSTIRSQLLSMRTLNILNKDRFEFQMQGREGYSLPLPSDSVGSEGRDGE